MIESERMLNGFVTKSAAPCCNAWRASSTSALPVIRTTGRSGRVRAIIEEERGRFSLTLARQIQFRKRFGVLTGLHVREAEIETHDPEIRQLARGGERFHGVDDPVLFERDLSFDAIGRAILDCSATKSRTQSSPAG